MPRKILFAILVTALAGRAAASVTITVDRLDPKDGGHQPPPHIVVVDVLVDVSEGDSWTAGGFGGFARNGAQFIYARDPNNPDFIRLVNPGTDRRFVCFMSEPRPRDGNGRFINGGADIAGNYCTTGPVPWTSPDQFGGAYFASPPETIGSPSVDGAVLRVALDVSGACNGDTAAIFPLGGAPPGYVPLMESHCFNPGIVGTAAATFDVPSTTGLNWGLYALPASGPPCMGDFDCSGRVSLPDLALFLSSFGQCSGSHLYIQEADFNQDGCIGLIDLSAFLPLFDSDCP